MRKLFLSYPLGIQTPSYGNKDPFVLESTKSLSCGDSCNQYRVTFNNHLGTHIDCPRHFDDAGSTIEKYPADFWFSDKVWLLNLPANPGELINLEPYIKGGLPEVEVLLIRTGFYQYRGQRTYWENNPGLSVASCQLLREKFKNLKIVGFDFISLSSYQHRPEGREAHKALLHSQFGKKAVLIIEDMDLSDLEKSPELIIVSPLRLEGLDGAPVTVIAEVI